jgi:protein involved in polysaccharide export with SLBB domain
MKRGPAFLAILRRLARLLPFAHGLVLLAGCVSGQPHVDQELLGDRRANFRNQGMSARYMLSCPDEVEIAVTGRPDLTGRKAIGPDGRVAWGPAGAVRIEGQTAAEAALTVAKSARLPVKKVQVRVAQFKSKVIYLSGQGTGVPRAVAYQGQETVLDLLQRVGGITAYAAPAKVYVVRSHIADGGRPEVFHVDLKAIVMKKDQQTNLRLHPFDQVYVGESRRGKYDQCLPPCLRPAFEALCGIKARKERGPTDFVAPMPRPVN